MKTLRDFAAVLDVQTFAVTVLAIASTYACVSFNILAEIPTSLIGLAVVFPIVFSINAAYKRREDALLSFAGIKANAVSLYYAHRDWIPGGFEATPDSNVSGDHSLRIHLLIQDLLRAIRTDLTSRETDESNLTEVYAVFSAMSQSHEALRAAGVTGSELSRVNQYLSNMMRDYELLRNIAAYRTPVTLRAYSSVFLNLFPVAFGPYFAFLCAESTAFPEVGYVVAVLYSLVLVSLDNLQEHLENPFDGVGADDIELDAAPLYSRVMTQTMR